jgi:ribosome-associated protein|tara:strand:+ start:349 stop:735 length:387 start_codon:yes stop_codon:yes gene_type:complete
LKVQESEVLEIPTIEEINDLIIDAIQDIKGLNILKIDLNKIEDSPANYFIICEGESTVQVGAIASNINKRLRKEIAVKCYHLEGMKESRWVLLDYFDTIVHVFYPETRQFYDIEDLWSDGEFTEYKNL